MSLGLAAAVALLLATAGKAAASGQPAWVPKLRRKLARVEAANPGQLGVFVADLRGKGELSFRGDESWYVASGVKVPVAIEVLRQADSGRLSLEERVRLGEDDFVDGAGETNRHPPGSLLSLRYLLEQMLIHSDNTASDLLIRRVGLQAVNELVRAHAPGFGEITTLGDVRRHAFSAFHPAAFRLANRDFLALKAVPDERRKLAALAAMVGVPSSELRFQALDPAYSAYYSKRLNSASLRAYAELLRKAYSGRLLGAASTRYLLEVLSRVETGTKRIRAGLPEGLVFAHKTGTQHARICDFGVAWDPSGRMPGKAVVAACSRGVASTTRAEAALEAVGKAISESGLLTDRGAGSGA